MKIQYNKKYVSELIANTDLHAGGIFFCIIYRDCLEFFDNGMVEITKKVVDAFRPMDDMDERHLERYKLSGTYSFNDRGYLICSFEEAFLKYTGIFTEKDKSMLPFHIYDSRLSRSYR
ncbi:hypothetical protein [Fluviicola taffensis]|uniref:Uncharacterized protein n=1 Tax=Fluviicola taffensis (strain DSM 16823 / NCIMB 13979 / RW262) TaxID=755732 RepID=F2IDI5_FLUTR|nr:hypothetical protein [Fluviicola taffensis]AEA42361.1 hypothetical protein Fluta_0353 [Fluviicola taffensis DSM 16823]